VLVLLLLMLVLMLMLTVVTIDCLSELGSEAPGSILGGRPSRRQQGVFKVGLRKWAGP